MRKVMLLAAMLAMVLAAAAPAFAQATAINEGDDTQYNAVCQNILGSFGDITQNQSGNADAMATNDSAAAAEVAQEQGVTIAQVNQCLNNFDENGNGFVEVDEEGVVVAAGEDEGTVSATAVADDEGTASATAEASATAAAEGELPETGGASLLALGAGALLVAGGLVARRIVR